MQLVLLVLDHQTRIVVTLANEEQMLALSENRKQMAQD